MCYRISDMGLCKVEKGHTYSLTQFRDAQFSQLNEVSIEDRCSYSIQYQICYLIQYHILRLNGKKILHRKNVSIVTYRSRFEIYVKLT